MNELDVLKRFREDVPDPSTDAWLRARAAIEAVRETSEQPTQVESPHRGGSRSRRRLAVVSIVVAVAAATIGIALVLTEPSARGPGAPSSRNQASVRPPAAVVHRVVDALSVNTHTILYTQSFSVTPGLPDTENEEWDYPWNGPPGQVVREAGSASVGGIVQRKWGLTFTVPDGGTGNSGTSTAPLGDACGVTGKRIDVNFTNRTSITSPQSCVNLSPGLNTGVAFDDPKTGQPVSNIKTVVADGFLHVVGYPTVDGQPTVELKSATLGVRVISTLALWVNANTYLPLQSVDTSEGTGPDNGTTTTVNHYSFMSPTQENLANLSVTAPPGFTESASAVGG